MQIVVPSYRKLAQKSEQCNLVGGTQSTVPTGKTIHSSIGIPAGSRVLFFAGAQGDWAHALARTTQVHYTDISRKMVQRASRRFRGKGIRSFRVADAMRWPVKEKTYDYLASYEPFPLITRMPLIALKALAYCKGMRIVMSDTNVTSTLGPLFRLLHRLYGADAKKRISPMELVDNRLFVSVPARSVAVWQVNSNQPARAAAKLDLQIIHLLRGKSEMHTDELLEKLAQRGEKVDKKELSRSLRRIHHISTRSLIYPTGNAVTVEIRHH